MTEIPSFFALLMKESALSHLRNTAGGGIDRRGIHGLDGIDDHDVRLDAVGLSQDVFHVGLGQNKEVIPLDPEPLCPQFELSARFLARNVEHAASCTEHVANLHKQSGFSDAGFPGNENDRSVNQAAAEHAIKLSEPRVLPHIVGNFELAEPRGAIVFGSGNHADALRSGNCGSRFLHILDKGVPSAAVGAFSHPFRRFIFTFGADINCFQTFHVGPPDRLKFPYSIIQETNPKIKSRLQENPNFVQSIPRQTSETARNNVNATSRR